MSVKSLIKPLITACLLLFALQLVDIGELSTTLLATPIWVVVITLSGYLLGQVLSAFKWWIIASQGGIEASYGKALRAYLVGMFANFFGLGLVGGDLARGILLSKGHAKKTPAVASVVADRAQGLAVLALIGIATTLLFGQGVVAPELIWVLAALGFCIVLGWFVGPYTLLRFTPKNFRYRDKVEQIAQVFPKNPRIVLWICILSLLFHLLQIGLHWLIIMGLGVTIPFTYLLMVIPLINILSSLPISWNGLGVRENSYIFFLSPLYLSSEKAVAVGAIWLLGVVFSSLLGGCIATLGSELTLLKKKENTAISTKEAAAI